MIASKELNDALLGTLISFIILIASSCGPSDGGDTSDADDDWGEITIVPPDLPVLTPCPDGWVEVPPAEPGGVTTCDPWPDGHLVTPPQMTPCPTGWREITDPETGTVTCDPWPETGYETCTAIDEAHFPGEPGCARIGTACTDDDWASDLPGDGVIHYVLAGAAPGGDGTRTAPYATITDALTVAESGSIIAVSKGTFDEAITISTGRVTLWGACVAETVIAYSTPGETGPTINSTGNRVVVRNLRVEGERSGVNVQGPGRATELRDVVINGAVSAGITVTRDGILTGDSVVIRNARFQPGTGMFGRGLEVVFGSNVELTRALFEGNKEIGVIAGHTGTSVTLTDTAIRNTLSRDTDLTFGRGLCVQEGAVAEVTRSAIEHNREHGVYVGTLGSAVSLTDVVVRDTQSIESMGSYGRGVEVDEAASLEASRTLFERNRDVAVSVTNGASLRFDDVVIRDTLSREIDLTMGGGLNADNGGTIEVYRTIFERNRSMAIHLAHDGTSAVLSDVVVRDTQSQEIDGTLGGAMSVNRGATLHMHSSVIERNKMTSIAVLDPGTTATFSEMLVRETLSQDSDRGWGKGLWLSEGAVVEMNTCVVELNRDIGIDVENPGTVATLSDVIVRDTMSQETYRVNGFGLYLKDEAAASASRCLFERNRSAAIGVMDDGTSLSLSDVVIRDSLSRETDRRMGRGLNVLEGATVDVMRAYFDNNREVSLAVFVTGTDITLSDVVIRETQERECAVDTCSGHGAGFGIGTYGGGHIDISRFLITRSTHCGVQLAYGADDTGATHTVGGTIDMHDGEVSYNSVCGVNVQTEGFDIERLTDNVFYHHNPRNFDSDFLPVPDPETPEE